MERRVCLLLAGMVFAEATMWGVNFKEVLSWNNASCLKLLWMIQTCRYGLLG